MANEVNFVASIVRVFADMPSLVVLECESDFSTEQRTHFNRNWQKQFEGLKKIPTVVFLPRGVHIGGYSYTEELGEWKQTLSFRTHDELVNFVNEKNLIRSNKDPEQDSYDWK